MAQQASISNERNGEACPHVWLRGTIYVEVAGARVAMTRGLADAVVLALTFFPDGLTAEELVAQVELPNAQAVRNAVSAVNAAVRQAGRYGPDYRLIRCRNHVYRINPSHGTARVNVWEVEEAAELARRVRSPDERRTALERVYDNAYAFDLTRTDFSFAEGRAAQYRNNVGNQLWRLAELRVADNDDIGATHALELAANIDLVNAARYRKKLASLLEDFDGAA